MEKTYKLKVSHTRHGERLVQGTLSYLLQYFSYTFEIGHSRNRKIDKNPKTIKSFIKNLQASYDEKEAACYERTYIYFIQ